MGVLKSLKNLIFKPERHAILPESSASFTSKARDIVESVFDDQVFQRVKIFDPEVIKKAIAKFEDPSLESHKDGLRFIGINNPNEKDYKKADYISNEINKLRKKNKSKNG